MSCCCIESIASPTALGDTSEGLFESAEDGTWHLMTLEVPVLNHSGMIATLLATFCVT